MPTSLTRCPFVNHYCRPGVTSISRPQASEIQPGLLKVTGTYLYDHPQTSSKLLSPSSTQSSKSTPSQDLPWEEKTISCHCDLWGEDMGIEICAERGSARRVERDSRRIVRNRTSLFLYKTEVSHSAVQPLSRIGVSVYAKKTITRDILVGRKTVICEPRHGSSVLRIVSDTSC
jgi:hypothetical protein